MISHIINDYIQNSGQLEVVVFGNSFARTSFPAIVDALLEEYRGIRLVATSNCQPFFGAANVKFDNICRKFVNASIALIEELQPDIVFIIFA